MIKKIVQRGLIIYFVLTLPLTAVFVKELHFRTYFFAYLTRQANKVRPPKYVFVGDSITAAGQNWGLRLGWNPVSATAFGLDGFRTDQLLETAKQAAALRPFYIHLLAGTNDARAEKSPETFKRDFRALIVELNRSQATLVVTLVPYQGDAQKIALIDSYNNVINSMRGELHFTTLDLNPIIAPKGILLPQFSEDGIHFTEAAYGVWVDKLKQLLMGDHQATPATPPE